MIAHQSHASSYNSILGWHCIRLGRADAFRAFSLAAPRCDSAEQGIQTRPTGRPGPRGSHRPPQVPEGPTVRLRSQRVPPSVSGPRGSHRPFLGYKGRPGFTVQTRALGAPQPSLQGHGWVKTQSQANNPKRLSQIPNRGGPLSTATTGSLQTLIRHPGTHRPAQTHHRTPPAPG